jgi:hypothetical protein
MRCAKTPDGKPIAIGHKPPVIKPSEARVHASVGDNAVVNLANLEDVEESVTMSLNPSDMVVDDIPAADLDLSDQLQALVDPNLPSGSSIQLAPLPAAPTPAARPEAPAPIARPQAPRAVTKPGSSAGLRPNPNPTTTIHAPVAPDTCPHCKGKVRVGAVLCVQCGLTLKPPTDPATSTPPQGTGSGFFSKMLKAVVKPKEPTLPATPTPASSTQIK